MPVVLTLQDAHKRYGEQVLLDGANCALADDQKVGLIGRNGAGKSTLCRVLLGEEELDAALLCKLDTLREVAQVKIVIAHTQAIARLPCINSVGTIGHCIFEVAHIAGGRQQFY